VGTFVASGPSTSPPADALEALRSSLDRWVARARAAGLDDEGIRALFAEAARPETASRVA
jgi:hypothetical protein